MFFFLIWGCAGNEGTYQYPSAWRNLGWPLGRPLGRPGGHLYTQLAPENLKYYWTPAVVFQAIARTATATKYTSVGRRVSSLEAVMCAPTIEYRMEDCGADPRRGDWCQRVYTPCDYQLNS